MGKYAATRATSTRSKSGRAWHGTVNFAFTLPQSEGQYRFQSFLSGVDPTGLYSAHLKARDSTAHMRDYLNNRNLDWSDIRYPSLTSGFGSDSSIGRSTVMLSKNLAKLYL